MCATAHCCKQRPARMRLVCGAVRVPLAGFIGCHRLHRCALAHAGWLAGVLLTPCQCGHAARAWQAYVMVGHQFFVQHAVWSSRAGGLGSRPARYLAWLVRLWVVVGGASGCFRCACGRRVCSNAVCCFVPVICQALSACLVSVVSPSRRICCDSSSPCCVLFAPQSTLHDCTWPWELSAQSAS